MEFGESYMQVQTLWDLNNKTSNLTGCEHDNHDKHETEFLLGATNLILKIYPWVMILIGTISNSLSFVVFTRPKLKKSSTFFYLSCLCIIDLLTLYTFCINFIFLYQFQIDIQLLNAVTCRVYSFLIYFLPQFSAWTVVAVSFDRVISISLSVSGEYTYIAKKFNTRKQAAYIVSILFFCLLLLNVQFFFYQNEYVLDESEKIRDINIIYCSAENIKAYKYFYEIWVIFLLFFYLIYVSFTNTTLHLSIVISHH